MVALLAVLAHSVVLRRTGYTIDDVELVQNDPRLVVHGWDDAKALVTKSYWGDLFPGERLWRPVVRVTLALDRALFGHDPDAYHRTNVALHAAVTALVLLFTSRVVPGRRGPLLAASVFAVHPVHAEAVAGVVGRAEVLALLFTLGGALLHLRARDAAPPPDASRAGPALRALARAVPAALCFLVGFGSKEIALTAPFLLVLVEVALRQPGRARLRDLPAAVAPYLVYGLALAAYFWARGAVLGDQLPQAQAQTIGMLPLATRSLVAAEMVRDAAAALVVPAPATIWYPFVPPVPGPLVLLTVALHLGLVGWGAWALARGARPTRAVGAGTLGFYAALGPVSNLIPIGVVRADRLLYTPSAWAALVLAAVIQLTLGTPVKASRARERVWACLALLLLAPFAWQNVENCRAWSGSLAGDRYAVSPERVLRESTQRRFPDEGIPLQLAGQVWVDEGEDLRGLQALTTAMQKLPPEAPIASTARAGVGQALMHLGRPREALAVLEEGRAQGAPNRRLLAVLCQVALALSEHETDPVEKGRLLALADRAGREGTRAFPLTYELWLQWGTVLSNVPGRERDAVAALDQAVARRAEPWEALFNRARLRAFLRDREGALEDYRRCSEVLRAARGRGDPISSAARDVEELAAAERAELLRAGR